MWRLDNEVIGDQTIATPPPHRSVNYRVKMFKSDFSGINQARNVPTPTGRIRVCMNELEEQHINAKEITTESITNLGAITGIKRKRDEESESEEKKE